MFFIKRILNAILLSAIVLWVTPFAYFYFKPSSNKVNQDVAQFKMETNLKTQTLIQNNSKARFKAKVNLNPNIWTNEFEIDKGESDGILLGNAVTNSEWQLIGLVTQVKNNTGIIRAITNPKTNLPVWVGNPDNKGLLVGQYGYSSEVDWLKNNQDLDSKPVYTANFSKNTAANLFIGTAQNVQLGKSGSFYRVDVLDLANIWQTDGSVLVW